MVYNADEVEYWAKFSQAMGNEEFRRGFTALFLRLQDEDNRLIAREGLQNPSVNHLQYIEDEFE